MQLRSLGRSGLMVSPLCFGGNVFGWTVEEKRAFELLDSFLAAGCNFVDTADVYSRWVPGNRGGESETIIGNWIKSRGSRERVVIATKVGMELDGRKGLSPAHIRASLDASLRRLQTDYVDLYQAHVYDPETPVEETLAAFGELVAAGKVRAIGASNHTAAQLREALTASGRLQLPRYESLQPHYNLCVRTPFEQDLAPLCREQGLGVIPYYALAGGFLSGKYRGEQDFAKSARGPSMKKYLDARGLRILAALDAVAAEQGATVAQIALAWLLARPAVTAPIVSATSRAQLEEIVRAATLQLDAESLRRLDDASDNRAAAA